MPSSVPTVLIFDSGLGGLSVLAEAARARPDARFVYAADDAAFPYGRLAEAAVIARVSAVMERLIAGHAPDLVVIACNTASTCVLGPLRARFAIPFVGTVPAIKPAARLSRSKQITILGTPGTVAREYTRDLVETHASRCSVTLIGSPRLAAFAEAELTGNPVSDPDIAAEIEPCFRRDGGQRTDVIVLACTHYPLLLPRLEGLAPWPVTWVDPAPAIARRMAELLGPPAAAGGPQPEGLAVFTGARAMNSRLLDALAARGLPRVAVEAIPLAAA